MRASEGQTHDQKPTKDFLDIVIHHITLCRLETPHFSCKLIHMSHHLARLSCSGGLARPCLS